MENLSLKIETLRGYYDNLWQRQNFFENTAISSALIVLPAVIAAIWYKANDTDFERAQLWIYRAIPIVLAFYASFICYTRATSYYITKNAIEIENKVSELLDVKDFPKVQKAKWNTFEGPARRYAGHTFFGLATLIILGCYIYCTYHCYRIPKGGLSKYLFPIVHILLAAWLGILVIMARASTRDESSPARQDRATPSVEVESASHKDSTQEEPG